MKKVLSEDLIYQIPVGKVATYGQIARLIGRKQNSRLVGRVLSMATKYGAYPCHRVVNSTGRLVPGWQQQPFLLKAEGVAMKDKTHVDLKQCQWEEF